MAEWQPPKNTRYVVPVYIKKRYQQSGDETETKLYLALVAMVATFEGCQKSVQGGESAIALADAAIVRAEEPTR